MVACVNTVAFQGMDVQSIDVQAQISNGLPAFTIVGNNIMPSIFPLLAKISRLGCVLFCSLLAISTTFPHYAFADDWDPRPVLTCDEDKNLVMVRLIAGYDGDPAPIIKLPKPYAASFSELNSRPEKEQCTLKNGQTLKISSSAGEYDPGPGGGDPGVGFSLSLSGRFIFYNENFYSGSHYSTGGLNPFVVLYDGKTLIACKGPDDSRDIDLSNYQIGAADCKDVSSRLSGKLSKSEEADLRDSINSGKKN